MKRIIDANLNRSTEALRVLEEIARFYLDDKKLSERFKIVRHNVTNVFLDDYKEFLRARDTQGDVGVNIENPTQKKTLINIFQANFKRLQQALRTLSEYAGVEGYDISQVEKSRYESYQIEKEMFVKMQNKLNKIRLQDKQLYLVTSRNEFDNDDKFLNAIASALKGGVQIVQLREKSENAKKIIELGKRVRELCSLFDAIFIINDRVDIAHIVGADGVHIGQDDLDIDSARHLLGENAIVGVSTHSPEQALKAVEDGADYIGVGPVFETPTKPGRKSVGLEYVEWASENIDIPWYAIGGINLDNAHEVIECGASRLAVVRAIINAENPEAVSAEFKGKLENKKLFI